MRKRPNGSPNYLRTRKKPLPKCLVAKQNRIQIGKINGVFGVKGWLKIASYTNPKDNILSYKPWFLVKGSEEKAVKVSAGQAQAKGIIAQIDGITGREQAQKLVGWDVYIDHDQLPTLARDEYYWADLVGLAVENLEGIQLGTVTGLMETGANDVLLVKGDQERAIPFLQGRTVKSIDLESGKIMVDWDADF